MPAPMTDTHHTARGILFLLAALVAFSAMDALGKHLLHHYPTLQVIWARYAGQTLILLAVFPGRYRLLFATARPGLQALRSALQFGATLFFFASLNFIALAQAAAIMDVQPVLITLGAAIFLHERIGMRRIIGIGVALVGALIIIRPGLGVLTPAAALPLAGAFCYAGFAVATRLAGRSEGPWASLFYAGLLGSVLATAALPFVWQPIRLTDLPAFMVIGLIGTGAQFCLVRAFTLAEAAVLAPLGYVGLVLATLWGYFAFAELPDRWTLAGALVIVGAGLYVWHRETQSASRPQQ